MKEKPQKAEPPHEKKKPPSLPPKSLGPAQNLEEHVQPDWWRRIFNAIYLKTDGDVVDDLAITRNEVTIFANITKLTPRDNILDLCCGQGRHSLELARRGFLNIEGLDRSHYLIQKAKTQAKKEGLPVRFREGDARKLPFPPDTFDVVMILGNSFGYFETVEDDLRVLKEVSRVLKPWGRLLVDVSDGDYLRRHYQPRSWEWMDKKHFVCRERSLSADKQRLISREIVNHIDKGCIADQFYSERLYSRNSLTELFKRCGLNDVAFHGEITADSQRNQDLGMMARRILATTVARKEWTPIKAKKKQAFTNVVVVLGDPTKVDPIKPKGVFDDDDIYTVDQLKGALRELELTSNLRFTYLNNHDTLIQDLMKLKEKGKVDFVFNLCDEGFENDARKELCVPVLLEMLRVPYTGSGPQCLSHCYDKSLIRGIAKEMDIPVPRAFFIKPEDKLFEIPFDFPAIVKPNFGDSSFGITQRSVAYNIEELVQAITEIRERFGYDKPILVEEFLTGKDMSVGIIGNQPESYNVLPIIEEDYSALPPELPRICGYEAKWLPDSPYWNLKSVPANLPEDTEKFVIECCLKLIERLDVRDYCRIDWRLNSKGKPKLLEVNPNPGWCWDGHLAKMAGVQGMAYKEVLSAILQAADQRMSLQASSKPEENGSKVIPPPIIQESVSPTHELAVMEMNGNQ
jgi:D-alanine-D-alanine ligase